MFKMTGKAIAIGIAAGIGAAAISGFTVFES